MKINNEYIKRLREVVFRLADEKINLEIEKDRVPPEISWRIDYLAGYVEALELLVKRTK